MGAISRNPAPAGPIRDLFDRLHDLHLQAGEPSVRKIVQGIGRGAISASTVYNSFSGPKVPNWGFLELIVEELDGPVEEFRSLWQAARIAEKGVGSDEETKTPEETKTSEDTSFGGPALSSSSSSSSLPATPPPPSQETQLRSLWGAVPLRNPYFTARHAEIQMLYERFHQPAAGSRAQALYGHGGVGKTEIATEYAHRYQGAYDLVWWIRAEQEDLIRDTLVELGRHLEVHDMGGSDSDRLIRTTLDALQEGIPYRRALLVFDNAIRPEVVLRYLPAKRVHVLVTTQAPGWKRALDDRVLDVMEFDQAEAVEFLRHRVPRLAPVADEEVTRRRAADAMALASVLNGVPLAVEQAAAYLNQTAESTPTYIEKLRHAAAEIAHADTDFVYPHAVATVCALSQDALSPPARALLRVVASISPEPISGEILVQPHLLGQLPEEVRGALAGTQPFRRTVRELARFSLVHFNRIRNETQIHRIVKAIVEEGMRQDGSDTVEEYRRAAHILLAGSDPKDTEPSENDAVYERTRPHLIPSGAVTSDYAPVRELVINQARHLVLRYRFKEARTLASYVLGQWRRTLGRDHLQTLAMAMHLGVALRESGYVQEALELNNETMEALRLGYGVENDIFLACARSHSIDLRTLGNYAEALRWDEDWLPHYVQEFGADHNATLNMVNNIAIGLRCLGRYDEALRHDRDTHAKRASVYGRGSLRTLSSHFAVARDLERLGRYEDALDELTEMNQIIKSKGLPWRLLTLLIAMDHGVALRRCGDHQEALNHLEAVLSRHLALAGPRNRQTLLVAINLINDLRLTGDLDAARRLGEESARAWAEVTRPDHPNTLAARANLAIVHRLQGRARQARDDDAHVLAGMTEHFGEEHPHCLVVTANLASDHAALGDPREAVRLGRRALERSRARRGEEHPFTLATAANLALDLWATGDAEAADEARRLHDRTLSAYRSRLNPHHPETRAVEQRQRVDLDIAPDYV